IELIVRTDARRRLPARGRYPGVRAGTDVTPPTVADGRSAVARSALSPGNLRIDPGHPPPSVTLFLRTVIGSAASVARRTQRRPERRMLDSRVSARFRT